jgi:hypothetical protein
MVEVGMLVVGMAAVPLLAVAMVVDGMVVDGMVVDGMVVDGMVVVGMGGGVRGGGATPIIIPTIRIIRTIRRRLWPNRRRLKRMSNRSRSRRNPVTGISAGIRKAIIRT